MKDYGGDKRQSADCPVASFIEKAQQVDLKKRPTKVISSASPG